VKAAWVTARAPLPAFPPMTRSSVSRPKTTSAVIGHFVEEPERLSSAVRTTCRGKRHEGFDILSTWRPDGRKLLFMSDRATATNPEGDFELFVMDANGSNQTQITFNALDDEHPAWSPDGTRIVFVRDFDPIIGEFDEDILTMNADGSKRAEPHQHTGRRRVRARLVAAWSADRLRQRR
jgi:dipeptidyl aminopeptidase/acylaminoacyl peptidase